MSEVRTGVGGRRSGRGGPRRGAATALAMVAAFGCSGAAAKTATPEAGRPDGAPRDQASDGRPGADRSASEGGDGAAAGRREAGGTGALGLEWLAGGWSTGDGRTVEHWTAVGGELVGVGFSGDGKATRSFEVMTIGRRGEKLVFTARPGGGSAVQFAEEARGERSITFANPKHEDPKRVAYREVDGRLIAATEGAGGRQEWRLERARRAAAPDIEKASRARGDRVTVSGTSPAGDVGFSIGRDGSEWPRVTIWRRDPERAGWVAVFDLPFGR